MRQWVKNRWKELRWGVFVYVGPAITFINFTLLLNLNYGLTLVEAVLLVNGLAAVATVVGFFHRKVQQDTDALLENKAVIDEIERRVRKALEDVEK